MDGTSGIAAQSKFSYCLEQIGTVSSSRGHPYQRTWPSRDISDHSSTSGCYREIDATSRFATSSRYNCRSGRSSNDSQEQLFTGATLSEKLSSHYCGPTSRDIAKRMTTADLPHHLSLNSGRHSVLPLNEGAYLQRPRYQLKTGRYIGVSDYSDPNRGDIAKRMEPGDSQGQVCLIARQNEARMALGDA